jgi:hypothetical protein
MCQFGRRLSRHTDITMKRTAFPSFLLSSTLAIGFGWAGMARAESTHAVEAPKVALKAGKTGSATVTVLGRNGWHVNEEAPITLTLKAPAGVAIAKANLSRPDLGESKPERARFDVSVTSEKAGTHQVPAEARFVMCQESACKPVKENVMLVLEVSTEAATKGHTKKAK